MRSMVLSSFLLIAGAATLVIGARPEVQAQTSGPQGSMPVKVDVAGTEGTDWTVLTIELQPGAVDSWRSHPRGELVYVLAGAGRLEMDGKLPITLNPGTVAMVRSSPGHVLKNTSRTKALKILVVSQLEEGRRHPILAERKAPGYEGGREPILNGDGAQRKTLNRNESRDVGLVF